MASIRWRSIDMVPSVANLARACGARRVAGLHYDGMADETTNLVLEHLRHMRGQLDGMSSYIHDMKVRVTNVEEGLALVNRRLDRVDERLDRIERRLDLVETPAAG